MLKRSGSLGAWRYRFPMRPGSPIFNGADKVNTANVVSSRKCPAGLVRSALVNAWPLLTICPLSTACSIPLTALASVTFRRGRASEEESVSRRSDAEHSSTQVVSPMARGQMRTRRRRRHRSSIHSGTCRQGHVEKSGGSIVKVSCSRFVTIK